MPKSKSSTTARRCGKAVRTRTSGVSSMTDLFDRNTSRSLSQTVRRFDGLSESEPDRLAAEGAAEFKRRNAEIEERDQAQDR